jgi:hypothetical protein
MPPESRKESELNIPQDLLAEVERHLPARRGDFKVEGWKPSFMARVFGFLDKNRSSD